MNYRINSYFLLIPLAITTATNAMVSFEDLAELAKIYCDNNAIIEKTAPSTDPAYQKFSDNAQRMLNSDKLSDAQKAHLVASLDLDDDGLSDITEEYVNKTTDVKTGLKALYSGQNTSIKNYLKSCAQIAALLGDYLGLNLDLVEDFQLPTDPFKEAYEKILDDIVLKQLAANRKAGTAVTPTGIVPPATPTGVIPPTIFTPIPSIPGAASSKPWLDELVQFFTDEITKRGTSSKVYDDLAQSIEMLATTPGNGPSVIGQILAYVAANSSDEQYKQTVASAFAKLANTINGQNFKQTFGADFKELAALAPYLNEATLRSLFSGGYPPLTSNKDRTAFVRTINSALITQVFVEIKNRLSKAATDSEVNKIYDDNKVLFSYAKQVPALKADLTVMLKKWKRALDFGKPAAQVVPSDKLLTPEQLKVVL